MDLRRLAMTKELTFGVYRVKASIEELRCVSWRKIVRF